MKFNSLIMGIICIGFSSHSYATEPLKTISTLPSSPTYLIKLVVGLIAVIGLFSALAWLVRRFGIGGFTSSATGDLKILESLSLGSRERLIIIQAGDEKLLLGITAGTINKLHAMESTKTNKVNFDDHLKQQQNKS